jgi:hypothetical protein
MRGLQSSFSASSNTSDHAVALNANDQRAAVSIPRLSRRLQSAKRASQVPLFTSLDDLESLARAPSSLLSGSRKTNDDVM